MRFERARVIMLFTLTLILVFLPVILDPSQVFSYRDAGQFYYPQFQFIHDQWQAGEFPLWNPYQNLGVPFAANAVTALFYPPSWLFLLPLPVHILFNMYIIGHVVFAGFTIGYCCRKWGISWSGTALAAISYGFSGPFLFQYSNVIYLISGAWLPLGIFYLDKAIGVPTLKNALPAGLVLAMVTLGGDPQTAYNLGIITGLAVIIRVLSNRKNLITNLITNPITYLSTNLIPTLRRYICILAAIAVIGFFFAAVQVLPLLGTIRDSDRITSLTPTDENTIYQFSLPPWRLAEFLWGGCVGSQFPQYNRWLDIMPGNDVAFWVPTLYMSAIVFLLAVLAMRLGRGSVRRRWLSWIVILALTASMGRVSIGHLLYTCDYWLGSQMFSDGDGKCIFSQGFGGVYWLLTCLFPGYGAFRYPPKWLPIASAALALLAAMNWDYLWRNASLQKRLGRLFWYVFIVTLPVTIFMFLALLNLHEDVMKNTVLKHLLYGPLQPVRPYGMIVSTVMFYCFYVLFSGIKDRQITGLPYLVLVVIVFDLVFFNRSIISTADYRAFVHPQREKLHLNQTPVSDGVISDGVISDGVISDDIQVIVPGLPLRVYRQGNNWLPKEFRETSSPNRETEIAAWNRESLFAMNAVAQYTPTTRYSGTFFLDDYAQLLRFARRHRVAVDKQFCQMIMVYKDGRITFRDNLTALPRCWIASGEEIVAVSAGINNLGRPDYTPIFESLLTETHPPKMDFRRKAVVDESFPRLPATSEITRIAENTHITTGDHVTTNAYIVSYRCDEVVVRAETSCSSLLVLADQYTSDWTAEIVKLNSTEENDIYSDPTSVEVYRVNGILRGVVLPEAGIFEVRLAYRPMLFAIGQVISLSSWVLFLLYCFIASVQYGKYQETKKARSVFFRGC